MSYVCIPVHAVWGTKNRYPYFTNENKMPVIFHILDNARKKEIHIIAINIYRDHVHCLLHLNADDSLSKLLQLIKGESAFWINKERMFNARFEWADEYFAAAVDTSIIPKVKKYITNQDEHHKVITFEEEYNGFIAKLKEKHQG